MYQMKLTYHYGLLVLFFQQTIIVTGTYEDCLKKYEEVQLRNLLIGWWSIFSIILNPIILFSNYNAKMKLEKIHLERQSPTGSIQ